MSLLQQMTGDSEVSLLYSYHGCLTGDDTRKEERMFGYRNKHGTRVPERKSGENAIC